jgi:membrane fusion protein (multidrug efflux system)
MPTRRPSPMRPLLSLPCVFAVLLFAAACSPADEEDKDPVFPVTVSSVGREDVAVERDYAGRARGAREVEIRARVEGILQERLYEEGEVVEEGEAMFRIDQAPFQVALRRAEAERATAQADQRQAQREADRLTGLFEKNAISEREYDRARTTRELAEAQLARAESQVAQARLDLGYTQVRAPLGGITSLEALSEGSLLTPGTLLATVVQQDPIHVRFSLPERDAAVQRAARDAARAKANDAPIRHDAQLLLPDGEIYRHAGSIDFTASTVDRRTGSVTARAVFPNPDNEVVPGQFVRVRVLLQTLENVVVIPELAVSEGDDGPQVYVLNGTDTVATRAVRLGPAIGGRQVVLEGLETDDQIVVNGHVELSDGARVRIRESN